MTTPRNIILNADDYALSRGITDAILALAEAGRLSSTSAMVTEFGWARDAGALKALRGRLAIGLHLNLTDGVPLGPMPNLAPTGTFPHRPQVMRRALVRHLDRNEIRMEVRRQLARFDEELGFPPDFVDGHHHVHVFPVVREALIEALRERFPEGGPLIRDPGDQLSRILRRKVAATKAATVAILARGIRRLANGAGFPTNDGFSGFSTFGEIPYATEFDAFLMDLGPRPMIMCHPGLKDHALGARDGIAARRPEEYAVLSARADLPAMLWRPDRAADAMEFPW
jgi:predicted glycoside hydrolase/deacetylase ChbG (UPF0249 family)